MLRWFTHYFKFAAWFLRGTNLFNERELLLAKLGRAVAERIEQGKMEAEGFQPILHQLGRLDKEILDLENHIRETRAEFSKPPSPSSESAPQ